MANFNIFRSLKNESLSLSSEPAKAPISDMVFIEKKSSRPAFSKATVLASARPVGKSKAWSRRNRRKPASSRVKPETNKVLESVKAQLPPALQLSMTIVHTFRFRSSDSAQHLVTIQNLAGACGGICTVGNLTFTMWASSVQLRKVHAWPAVGGSVQIEFNGTEIEMKDVVKDKSVPTGVTETGVQSFIPPEGTLARFWHEATNTDNLIAITCSTGSILDVEIAFVLAAGFGTASSVITTGTQGFPYYLALDGHTSNKFVPVGLPTTS